MEREINSQQFNQSQQGVKNSKLFFVVVVSVLITAFVIGGFVYWWQETKFNRKISVLQQSIAELNEQIVSLGGTAKPNETSEDEQSIKEKIVGDYQWDYSNLESQYSNISWNKITTYRLAGFSPNTALTEKRAEGCEARDGGNYLRVEGGMCSVGFWLEKADGERIDSLEKLASNFSPVENEAEAVSFATITNSDLEIDDSGIPEGHVLAISDGFLVQLVHKNTFGCGSHEPTGVIFKVANNGNIQRIANEKSKPPLHGKPELCVD